MPMRARMAASWSGVMVDSVGLIRALDVAVTWVARAKQGLVQPFSAEGRMGTLRSAMPSRASSVIGTSTTLG